MRSVSKVVENPPSTFSPVDSIIHSIEQVICDNSPIAVAEKKTKKQKHEKYSLNLLQSERNEHNGHSLDLPSLVEALVLVEIANGRLSSNNGKSFSIFGVWSGNNRRLLFNSICMMHGQPTHRRLLFLATPFPHNC